MNIECRDTTPECTRLPVRVKAYEQRVTRRLYTAAYDQLDNGFITKDDANITEMTKIFAKKIEKILKKFVNAEPGQFKNEKLEAEILKTIKYLEKQAGKGKKGERPPKNNNPNESQKKGLGFSGLTQTKAKKSSSSSSSVLSIDNTTSSSDNSSELSAPKGILFAPDRPGHSPSWEAVEEFFFRLGHPEEAVNFFNYWEGRHWKKGITPIMNMASFANRWLSSEIGKRPKNKRKHLQQAR